MVQKNIWQKCCTCNFLQHYHIVWNCLKRPFLPRLCQCWIGLILHVSKFILKAYHNYLHLSRLGPVMPPAMLSCLPITLIKCLKCTNISGPLFGCVLWMSLSLSLSSWSTSYMSFLSNLLLVNFVKDDMLWKLRGAAGRLDFVQRWLDSALV